MSPKTAKLVSWNLLGIILGPQYYFLTILQMSCGQCEWLQEDGCFIQMVIGQSKKPKPATSDMPSLAQLHAEPNADINH